MRNKKAGFLMKYFCNPLNVPYPYQMHLSFTRKIHEAALERLFFSSLGEMGNPVEIESNMPRCRHSYCVQCGVKLHPAVAQCSLCGTSVFNPNCDSAFPGENLPDRINTFPRRQIN